MNATFSNWSPGSRRLCLVAGTVTAAVALSYDYVVATGTADAFFAILGVGLALALLVAAPLLRREYQKGSDR